MKSRSSATTTTRPSPTRALGEDGQVAADEHRALGLARRGSDSSPRATVRPSGTMWRPGGPDSAGCAGPRDARSAVTAVVRVRVGDDALIELVGERRRRRRRRAGHPGPSPRRAGASRRRRRPSASESSTSVSGRSSLESGSVRRRTFSPCLLSVSMTACVPEGEVSAAPLVPSPSCGVHESATERPKQDERQRRAPGPPAGAPAPSPRGTPAPTAPWPPNWTLLHVARDGPHRSLELRAARAGCARSRRWSARGGWR